MSESSLEEYRKINSIIERDSTDATYKYALLRGTIEICEEYQHLGKEEADRIWFPLGLLIEKWIIYYYPIVANGHYIPQKRGERADGSSHMRMTFRPLLTEIAEYYKATGGDISRFYSEYEKGSIPDEIAGTVLDLCRKLRTTITEMPMNHLGYSYAKKLYSVFNYRKKPRRISSGGPIDRDFLIENFGEYSISKDLNDVLLYFGGFISGDNTLLLKWATFSSLKSGGRISVAEVMEVLQKTPETERDTTEAQEFYNHLLQRNETITCVWTGRKINSMDECHLDHILPFAAWKNNELWNLMPAMPEINAKKSDKIPSMKTLVSRKAEILNYWEFMREYNPIFFDKEIRISLVGDAFDKEQWQEQAFDALKEKCRYLIEIRGCNEWDL